MKLFVSFSFVCFLVSCCCKYSLIECCFAFILMFWILVVWKLFFFSLHALLNCFKLVSLIIICCIGLVLNNLSHCFCFVLFCFVLFFSFFLLRNLSLSNTCKKKKNKRSNIKQNCRLIFIFDISLCLVSFFPHMNAAWFKWSTKIVQQKGCRWLNFLYFRRALLPKERLTVCLLTSFHSIRCKDGVSLA